VSAAWPSDTRGLPLWLKLAVFGAIAIVATHAAHLAIGSRVAGDALLREQESLGRGIARLVASQAADALLVDDWVTVDELAVRTAQTQGIGYCFIVSDGDVVGSSLPPGVADRLTGLRVGDDRGPVVVADDGHRYLDLEEPILGGKAGYVRLGVDMQILQTTSRAIAGPLAIVAALAVVLSILLALAVGFQVARPIEELIEAADRFDPAQPLAPVHPRGGREISALARRFNGMTARLRAAHEEQERVRVRALANERLATLGSLVAGVAHEVNNPLASLKSAAAMLRDDGAKPELRAKDLDLLDRALDQIGDVVQRLLDFGRTRPLELLPVSARALAAEAAELAGMQLKRRGIVIDQLADPGFDDAPVLADRKQVSQALLNLLLNAAFVSRDFAHLRVRMRQSGPMRGIAVEDDGPGIPPEIRAKVFDPFFSTKPAGQGTGLGLTLARTVADRHHGALELECPAAGGTVATLWIPTPPRPETPSPGPGGQRFPPGVEALTPPPAAMAEAEAPAPTRSIH
jgi:signal transduction histidine kinase